jgi:hypothetical protein
MGVSTASADAQVSAKTGSSKSTCIPEVGEGEAAIADALRGEEGSFFALPSSEQISKLAEPTAEGPVCMGGVTGSGMGDGKGGVVGR